MKLNINNLKRLSFTLALLLCATLNAQKSDWELKKNENNVTVYTRTIAQSKIKEFKAEMFLKKTPQPLINILTDFDSYPNWVSGCKSVQLLKKINEQNYIYYLELEAPWPVSNRDVILNATITEKEDGSIVFDIKNIPNYIPEKNGIKRMSKFTGFWKFKNLKNGTTQLTHQVHAEPGGSIPAWLANSKVTDGPLETLTNLKKL